jgi:hypothetical protein
MRWMVRLQINILAIVVGALMAWAEWHCVQNIGETWAACGIVLILLFGPIYVLLMQIALRLRAERRYLTTWELLRFGCAWLGYFLFLKIMLDAFNRYLKT